MKIKEYLWNVAGHFGLSRWYSTSVNVSLGLLWSSLCVLVGYGSGMLFFLWHGEQDPSLVQMFWGFCTLYCLLVCSSINNVRLTYLARYLLRLIELKREADDK